MKTLWFAGFLCTLLLSFANHALSGPNMTPGLWEITTTTHMQGLNIPPSTTTQCLTEDDTVPRNTQPGQECEITDVSTSSDTVNWRMRCSGQGGQVESTGHIRYFGDRFEGSVTTVIQDTGMTLESTMKGTRVGDCK